MHSSSKTTQLKPDSQSERAVICNNQKHHLHYHNNCSYIGNNVTFENSAFGKANIWMILGDKVVE